MPTLLFGSLKRTLCNAMDCPWNSPGQNTGVGSHFLLQGIFLTQGSNPGLQHCRWILYQLSLQGSPIKRDNTNELIYKTEADSQTLKMSLQFPEGRNKGRDSQGIWDGCVHIAIFKIDNQQGPTLQHRELCSNLCGSLDLGRVCGRMGTCTWMAESLRCLPETITTFLISFPVAHMVKHLPAMWETWVQSVGWEDPLEKEMATHSNILAWKVPWMEDPGRLQSMGLQRVGHD